MKQIPLIILILFGIIGCAPVELEDFADDSKEKIASQYIGALLKGNFETLQNDIDHELKPQLTDEVLRQMQSVFGAEEAEEKNLIGYQVHTYGQNPTTYNLSYQYGYGDRWVVWNVAFRVLEDEKSQIIGLNVYPPLSQSLKDTHRFTLQNKGILHYIFLLLCIAIPVFILFTLVFAIRTKIKRRKWLWIIFILVGVVKLSLNWTTGQMGYQLINFSLMGSGVGSVSNYAPWIVSFSIPLGAILFWVKRKELQKEEVQTDGVTI